MAAYAAVSVWFADVRERLARDRGATAVEYALMLALIAAVIIGAVTLLGNKTSSAFGNYNSNFSAAS
ncbi:MAG: Flp family type IVb pilin [Actinomycetota bacterium]